MRTPGAAFRRRASLACTSNPALQGANVRHREAKLSLHEYRYQRYPPGCSNTDLPRETDTSAVAVLAIMFQLRHRRFRIPTKRRALPTFRLAGPSIMYWLLPSSLLAWLFVVAVFGVSGEELFSVILVLSWLVTFLDALHLRSLFFVEQRCTPVLFHRQCSAYWSLPFLA